MAEAGRVSPPRRVRVPHEVSALVRGLHPALKRKVRVALQAILDDPYAGKALCNELQGLRSYRVGRFRIIYRLRRDVELVAIGPRDSIYLETYRRIHEPRGRYRLSGSSGSAGRAARTCRPLAPLTRQSLGSSSPRMRPASMPTPRSTGRGCSTSMPPRARSTAPCSPYRSSPAYGRSCASESPRRGRGPRCARPRRVRARRGPTHLPLHEGHRHATGVHRVPRHRHRAGRGPRTGPNATPRSRARGRRSASRAPPRRLAAHRLAPVAGRAAGSKSQKFMKTIR